MEVHRLTVMAHRKGPHPRRAGAPFDDAQHFRVRAILYSFALKATVISASRSLSPNEVPLRQGGAGWLSVEEPDQTAKQSV